MHDTASATALSRLLNQFSVPMFAVERSGPRATFRFICLNDAMAATGGRAAEVTIGKTAFEILPAREAEVANDRYLECALTRSVVRYRDALTLGERKVIWDTTLQFVPLADGAERVVGTSIQLSPMDTLKPETITFEDIHYISTMADFQLQNLVTLFETYRGRDLFRAEAAPRIARLSSMCRSIQRAVSDIRRIAVNAQYKRNALGDSAGRTVLREDDISVGESDTIRALVEYSAEDTHNFGA